MKKTLKLAVLTVFAGLGALYATSCAAPLPVGCLYTDITMPGTIGNGDFKANRHGTASCYSILGWVAGGDASLNQAASNGNVDHVSWSSFKATNYFGIYGIYTTVVYGTGKEFGPDMTLAPSNATEQK